MRFAVLHLSRGLRGAGKLGESRYCVLSALSASPMTVSALAFHSRVSVASMSKLVSAMVEAGLVQRERDVVDARRVDISITEAGREALAAAADDGVEWLHRHIDGLEGEDIITLSRAAAIMRTMITT
nr:MarR family transcriptional regulator [Flaviflexus equikiangi]